MIKYAYLNFYNPMSLPLTSNPHSVRLSTGWSSFICFTMVLFPDSPAPSKRILTICWSSENCFCISRVIWKSNYLWYWGLGKKSNFSNYVSKISKEFNFCNDTLWDLSLASLEPRTYGNAVKVEGVVWPSALGLGLGLGIILFSFPMMNLYLSFFSSVYIWYDLMDIDVT